MAVAAAKDLPHLSLPDALELTPTKGKAQRLAPEPRPAPDTEPSLQGLVFVSILPCCPEKQGTDENNG